MKKLALTIAKEVEQRKHCAVYQPELNRVWPTNRGKREKAVAAFTPLQRWICDNLAAVQAQLRKHRGNQATNFPDIAICRSPDSN